MTMKYLLVPMICLLLLSCSKDDNENTDNTPKTTNVYVVGWEKNNGKNLAKIWKNGTATTLGTVGKASVGRSVFVSGNDVYAVIHE